MKYSEIRHRHRLLFAAAGASVLVLLGIAAAFVVLLSGAMSTAATTQHFALTHRILDAGLRFSVNASAAEIDVPPLNDAAGIELGLACYRQHCVQCHGSPAIARSDIGKGMLPAPSSLAQAAHDWSPAALYFITKKGIRMTGMPAWEFRLSEKSLWATVAFLQRLPLLTGQDYRRMETSATCRDDSSAVRADVSQRGDVLLLQYACHSCHVIDGVVGPRVRVGPPLIDWPRRKYIAGVVPNTRENLVRWIMDPESVSPQTLMPDLDVAEAHAREMAAYLMDMQ